MLISKTCSAMACVASYEASCRHEGRGKNPTGTSPCRHLCFRARHSHPNTDPVRSIKREINGGRLATQKCHGVLPTQASQLSLRPKTTCSSGRSLILQPKPFSNISVSVSPN